MDKKTLALKLYEVEGIKFGEFTLKSGLLSPVYIDLRVIISYPEFLRAVSEAMWELVKDLSFDLVCGAPYTALPIATVMSIDHNKPMVMRRKEVKDYGTKKAIEGKFSPGQTCLVVDDMITDGASKFETIEPLEHEGLRIKDIVILVDREQGGKANLESRGYHLHSVLTITEVLTTLKDEGKISQETFDRTIKFIRENQIKK
jgi:uridine monophosphate synthetase